MKQTRQKLIQQNKVLVFEFPPNFLTLILSAVQSFKVGLSPIFPLAFLS